MLSHPKCASCGTDNPYYKPEFAILQQSAADETETIKQQLEQLQAETSQREAQLRNEISLLQKQSSQQNTSLQEEIISLREQLQMLAIQNEQLRQQAEEAALNTPLVATEKSIERKKSSNLIWLWLLPLFMIPLFAWVYAKSTWKKHAQTTIAEAGHQPESQLELPEKKPEPVETQQPQPMPTTEPEQPEAITEAKVASNWQLTERILIKDVVGKRITGCDVQVQKSTDIQKIENLVLVEKINSDLYKYKCRIEINRNGNSYVATPYLYYRPGGGLVKIDGSNCEQL